MIIRELTNNWRFHFGECEEAWYKGYDDSSWKKVMIPHDWSVELPFSKNYSSGTGYLAGGIGWYRVRFTLPKEEKGKRVRLTFDGVYKNSQVWCNSYYLGKRPSGYTTFSYDISEFVNFGEEENEISVKVVHTDIADSRWFTGSGITRKVTLQIEEMVHPAEYGVVFEADEIQLENAGAQEQPMQAQSAQIKVVHQVDNTSEKDVNLQVKTLLYDMAGKEAMEMKGIVTIPAKGNSEIVLKEQMKGPYLWSTENPYLYTMKTWYQEIGGKEYPVHEEKVGIRSIFFDSDKGFFLNGIETKMKGVCVHHDGGCLGSAMKAEVWQRRLALLKESGCNAIRCSHNPHMPELYALCDAMGFLMMDEAFDEWENPKNKWSTGHNVYPPKHQGYYEDFPKWHEDDLRKMVRRDRNHPSVIMWSIGNEIDYPNDPYCHPMFQTMTGNNDTNKPAAERQYDTNKPNMERLTKIAKELVDIVKEEDTSRPVTLAAAFPELSSRLGFLDNLDVVGYNYKEHLYEEDHLRFPDKPFLGSENGHSYEAWKAVTEHPYISGQFLWTGIDYLGEAHGWPVHGSPAGIVTTAGLAKPEFYRRKSFWCKEKMIHIATTKEDSQKDRWGSLCESWNYEPGTRVTVKCFATLCEIAEGAYVILKCNEAEIGQENVREAEGAFVFSTEYQPGTLEAFLYEKGGQLLATDTLQTTKEATQIVCKLWQEPDAISGKGWKEVSEKPGYLYQMLLSLKDEDGKDVVWNEKEVKVQVQGAGVLAGLDNGNLADVTPFSSDTRQTYHGKMVAYVRRTEPGSIKVMIELKADGGERYEIQMD